MKDFVIRRSLFERLKSGKICVEILRHTKRAYDCDGKLLTLWSILLKLKSVLSLIASAYFAGRTMTSPLSVRSRKPSLDYGRLITRDLQSPEGNRCTYLGKTFKDKIFCISSKSFLGIRV